MGEAGRWSRPGPGDVLGDRYQLSESLGSGGMADVFRATDLRLGRTVAVKLFRADVADAIDPQRTNRETHLLGGVNHRSVVGVLDASDDSSPVPYLVMELVEGHDLAGLLAAGPLPPDLVRRIVADVADALALLHSRTVVHRDVKPANVLVLDAGTDRTGVTAKLTDFGIAQIVDSTRITAPDSILGTAAYLSPEQVRGGSVGAASDVYSLGLVLIECLTGDRAFPGPVSEAAVARLVRPPALPENASVGLAELLSRMTALDPEVRPTAAEVADALRGDLVGAMTAPEATSTARIPVVAVPAAASLFDDLAALSDAGEERPHRAHRVLATGFWTLVLALVAGLGVVLAGPSLTTGLFAVAPITRAPASGAAVGAPLGDTAGPASSEPAVSPSPTPDPSPSSTGAPAAAVPAAPAAPATSSSHRTGSPRPSVTRSTSPRPSPSSSPPPSRTPTPTATATRSAPASTATSPAPSPSPTENSGTPPTSRSASPQPTPSRSR
jgi:serine/threonine protein kinase